MLDNALGPLRSLRAGGVLTIVYLGLVSLALRAEPAPLARACWAALALVALLAWMASLRRARAIAEVATSRIASAAQGYVELEGVASADRNNLIRCPLSGAECVWYRYRLYSRDNIKKEWREVDQGVSSATFEITDATGACRVDPDGAEVVGATVRTTYPDQDKLVEELLLAHSPIYVLGEFSTIGGANAPSSLREDVADLLTEWKADRRSLLRRFDLDANGELDLHEWELARGLAVQTVERGQRELRSQPGVNMIKASRHGRPFLISTLSPKKLRQRFLLWGALHLAIGLAACAVWLRWVRISEFGMG